MNRITTSLSIAAAALVAPWLIGARPSSADAAAPVPTAQVFAAVDQAEAERKAAEPTKIVPTKQAAELDRMAGAAEKIDPAQIDPKLALGALTR